MRWGSRWSLSPDVACASVRVVVSGTRLDVPCGPGCGDGLDGHPPMTTDRSKAKKKADRLFSALIRSVGFCENCGSNDYRTLQCAHLISRRYAATRCDLDNAFCLCAGCHIRFTQWPKEFADFFIKKKGEDGYQTLVAKSQSRLKVDWDETVRELTELLKASVR